MLSGKIIAVVVPAFNEEKQISKVINTMPHFVDKIIIVDDCSPDKTSEVVREHQKTAPEKVVLIRHDINQGVGGAIATGYKWCAENLVDVAVVMAGDAQMDPQDLPNLLEPVVNNEVDYAKGNRLLYDDAFKTIPKVRLVGNSILSLLTKIASGYWHVSDSQTGYTAINRSALRAIHWDDMYKRYGMPNDLLVRLNIHNFKVKDVKIKPVYRVGEQSKMKVRRVVFTISWLLLKLFFWRLFEKYVKRDFHPLVFFYFLGFISSVISLGLFIRLILLWTQLGFVPEMTALALMFTTATSLQSFFFAMLFDMESNKHLR